MPFTYHIAGTDIITICHTDSQFRRFLTNKVIKDQLITARKETQRINSDTSAIFQSAQIRIST